MSALVDIRGLPKAAVLMALFNATAPPARKSVILRQVAEQLTADV